MTESAGTIVAVQGTLRRLLRAVYFLSLAGFVWGIQALGTFDPFGLKLIADHLRGTESTRLPLRVRGPYRWVRHPLYAFVLLMIWSCPDLTADRLLFNVLFSAWMIVGTILEERDLVIAFGAGDDDLHPVGYHDRRRILGGWRPPHPEIGVD